MAVFDRALAAALDGVVRGRVERAWISAHRAALETQAWTSPFQRRRLVKHYIELARRHGMTRASEGRPAEDYFASLLAEE
jgi:hypothetical protein